MKSPGRRAAADGLSEQARRRAVASAQFGKRLRSRRRCSAAALACGVAERLASIEHAFRELALPLQVTTNLSPWAVLSSTGCAGRVQLLGAGIGVLAEVARTLTLTPNTAASYTKALYRKLEVTNRAEATLEATRRGLIKF
jgi:DNA-binding CsgD family transcriptional regulator